MLASARTTNPIYQRCRSNTRDVPVLRYTLSRRRTARAVSRCALLYMAGPAQAEPETPRKFTVGQYRTSDGHSGHDMNLRWRTHDSSFWIGAYEDPVFGRQGRIGADTAVELGHNVLLQPSLQMASRGFLGASANLQVGDPWFAVVGWGRTNLKPYFNLNFDPNDAITAGVGWHGPHGQTVSLTLIADDRLHTGQRHWHLYSRVPISNDLRLTVDLLHKSGEGDGGPVRAWGLSVALDFPHWFVRVARDPKQNFSTQDATRISAGLRF